LKVKLSFVCGNFVGDLKVLTTFKQGKIFRTDMPS
jgi:hypothetical protein